MWVGLNVRMKSSRRENPMSKRCIRIDESNWQKIFLLYSENFHVILYGTCNFTTLTCDPSTCIDDDGYIWVGVAHYLGQVALETLYQTEVLVRIVLRGSRSKIICPEQKKINRSVLDEY